MAKTIDLEINDNLKVTFGRDGEILHALAFSEGFQDWIECTKYVQNSRYWTGIARDEFADYMENKTEDYDDWEIE